MTMDFHMHDAITAADVSDGVEISGAYALGDNKSRVHDDAMRDEFYLLRDKLQIPSIGKILKRTRIDSLLERSMLQFPATLICGRSGTGKTALAASFAARFEETAWYTAESTDIDWSTFSRYLAAAITCETGSYCTVAKPRNIEVAPTQGDIAAFMLRVFAPKSSRSDRRTLLVLDDIHHIFDAEWFEDFLNLMLYSLPETVHVIMLCRSQPDSPLWRLRSKQMLNVIDERTIAFTLEETEALFASRGLPAASATEAYKESFGRVSKILLPYALPA